MGTVERTVPFVELEGGEAVEVYVGVTVRVPVTSTIEAAVDLAYQVADSLDALPLEPAVEAAGASVSAPTGMMGYLVDSGGSPLVEV
jgi:hypothetical protein